MIYLKLFWAFFQIGLFSIGGGYAVLPLIQSHVVEDYGWLTMSEYADIVTISQMTPGPIALNAATFVGTNIGGVLGAVIATLGCIAPSCIIVLILAALYKKYSSMKYVQGALNSLRPAVTGLIASAGLSIVLYALISDNAVSFTLKSIDFIALALIALGVFLLRKIKLNPILIIFGAGVVGGVVYSFL